MIRFRWPLRNKTRIRRKERFHLACKRIIKERTRNTARPYRGLHPAVAALSWFAFPSDRETSETVTYPVEQGEFIISLNLKGGELEAVKAENIVAPRVRGELKVTHLFPEGEQVDVGDLLVQFEPTEFEKRQPMMNSSWSKHAPNWKRLRPHRKQILRG